jgi:hypothetical protein
LARCGEICLRLIEIPEIELQESQKFESLAKFSPAELQI